MNKPELVTLLHYAKTLTGIDPDVESIPKCDVYLEIQSQPPIVLTIDDGYLCPRCNKAFTIPESEA